MSTIYVVRHAEKPTGQILGVDDDGASDPESLSPQGWQRAGGLAMFFGSTDGLPAPNHLYAAAPGKQKAAAEDEVGSKSKRPMETITPLAQKLGIALDKSYTKGQEARLVDEIVALDGQVLVCWQHEAIPEIAKLIVGTEASIPDPWPGDRFDLVWSFTRSGARDPWIFNQVCQRLLAGDGTQPIA